MIDVDLVVEAFKKKISSMKYEEREAYFNKMGFSFGDESYVKLMMQKESNEIRDIFETSSDVSDLDYTYFIVELMQILGYKEISLANEDEDLKLERNSIIKNNGRIIKCIYPNIDFSEMLELLDTTEEQIKFLVQCRELLNKYKMEQYYKDYQKMR